jgi:hypothetical protein
MKDVLIIGLAAAAVYAVWRLSQPATAPMGAPGSSASNFGTDAENLVQARTGIPIASLGSAAQRAPTWLKLAVFPIGVTAVTQGVITHPLDTVKKVGGAVSSAAHSVGNFLGF